MEIIYYDNDADLRRILATRVDASAAAVVIVPASLARRLGLCEHGQGIMSWDAPGGDRAGMGSCCGVVEGLKVYQK